MKKFIIVSLTGILIAGYAYGEELVVHMYRVHEGGLGSKIGTVTATDSPYGLILTPMLADLNPGVHGFHLHQNPDCGPDTKKGKIIPGLAAGGHYDPKSTQKHEGPYAQGHLGDLPALFVGQDGRAWVPVLVPRLKVHDLNGHSLVIHKGGDNYSDNPKKLGGGGARVACGIVK